jgi:hypothetical protein
MCCLRRGSGEKVEFFLMALHSKCSCVTLSLEITLAGDGDGYQVLKKTMQDFGGGALHRPRPLTR